MELSQAGDQKTEKSLRGAVFQVLVTFSLLGFFAADLGNTSGCRDP